MILIIILNWMVIEAFMTVESIDGVSSIVAASVALGCFSLLRFLQLVFVIHLIKVANVKSKLCKVLTSSFVILAILALDVTSIVFGIYMIVYRMKFEIWQMIPYWSSSFLSGVFKVMVVMMIALSGCHLRQEKVHSRYNIQEEDDLVIIGEVDPLLDRL
jgi:hypothetical protein